MAIKLVNDIGAPLTVVAVDLVSESVMPQANEALGYVLAIGGTVLRGMGMGGDFTKNVAIAATPWAAKNLYQRARGIAGPVSRRLGVSSIARWPAPLNEQPFGGNRLV